MKSLRKIVVGVLAVGLVMAVVPEAVASFAEEGVPLDVAHFPDEQFRGLVQEYDSDENGVLEGWESDRVTQLYAHDSDISNLQGVQYFSNLQRVDFRSFKQQGKITDVDVSANRQLRELLLDGNPIKQIDVRLNQQLRWLWLDGSPITHIDVTRNIHLTSLHLESNHLSMLDVSNNRELQDLSIRNLNNGGLISRIDLKNNKKLTGLAAEGNRLAELDVSGNPELEELMIGDNQISYIDISHNKRLTGLTVENNRLKHIDLRNNPELTILSASGNQLTDIDLSNNKNLRAVYLDNNRLATVDFQGMKYLVRVHASNNQLLALTNMNMEECTGYSVFCTPGDGLKAEGQRYVSNSRMLDLSKTVPNIQLNQIREVRGGQLDRGVLRPYPNVSEVSYQYLIDDNNRIAVQVVFPEAEDPVVFNDVVTMTPHREDIIWLADNGISTGWLMPDGTYEFRGMDTVKRQDMAAFLRRLAAKYGIAGAKDFKPVAADWKRFKDVNSKTPHAEDILWLAKSGISTGWQETDGSWTFRGMDTVKRQDMAAFLYRLADRAGKASGVTPKTDFTDVTDGTPHYKDVQWLGGSGISQGYRNANGSWRFEGMTSVYRQDMAAFLHRLNNRLAQ